MNLFDSYEPPQDRCELCKHYKMIDSAFGYCKRFPPQVVITGFFRQKYEYKFPIVTWENRACGEFVKIR